MSRRNPSPGPLPRLHAGFLALLPRLERHGRVYFRHRQGDARAEAVAEMVALAWHWYLRLTERGKDPARFPAALASFAARAVGSGRRLVGQERAQDVLSPVAQRRHRFAVGRLPAADPLAGPPLTDALADNTVTPPPEQAAFRLDFPRWRRAYGRRDRRVLDRMAVGDRTLELAATFGLSPARISQLRRAFWADWRRFTADPADR